MMYRFLTFLLMISVILPVSASGQEFAEDAEVDTIVVKPKPSCLTLPAQYYHTKIDYSLSMPERSQTPNLSGFEVYRLSHETARHISDMFGFCCKKTDMRSAETYRVAERLSLANGNIDSEFRRRFQQSKCDHFRRGRDK